MLHTRLLMTYDYYIIDAFASEPGAGNAAAVVLDARGLTDCAMQKIAADFNLSETTFILPPERQGTASDADVSIRFRWFTPVAEVDLCGHATIAGLYAMLDSGRLDEWRSDPAVHIRIETRSGDLSGFVEGRPGAEDGRMIWLTLPPSMLSPYVPDLLALASSLGAEPDSFREDISAARTRDDDLLVFVRDIATLNAIAPDFDQLGRFLQTQNARGISVATTSTLTPSLHVQSRFFAPNLGVNEDPVTGSVTGPLAVHLVEQGVIAMEDGTAALVCSQGIPGGRTGLIYALVQRDDRGNHSARIGGTAVVAEKGTLGQT